MISDRDVILSPFDLKTQLDICESYLDPFAKPDPHDYDWKRYAGWQRRATGYYNGPTKRSQTRCDVIGFHNRVAKRRKKKGYK